ncbi:MAG: AAA family ATPase [Pseudomonadota bacterium]
MTDEFKYAIDRLTFSNGTEIEIAEDSLILIVGPNSSGKSSALRDIAKDIRRDAVSDNKVIKNVSTHKDGTEKGFATWIDNNFPLRNINGEDVYYIDKNVIQKNKVASYFNSLENITDFLLRALYTKDRLFIADSKRRFDLNRGKPQEFIHMLQLDFNLKREINSNLKLLFDKQLYINNGHDSNVWFHVGLLETNFDDASNEPENLKKLNKLPKLEEEGDGIKSFVATLLALECGCQPLLTIDEPELFLHSVQCRKLGKLLAENTKKKKRQIIAATHSSDIVQGALEADAKVTICRIERDGDVNVPCVLNTDDIKEYWNDPLLKSSNAIDGIFHEGVVICEGDKDCMFYNAILNKCAETKEIPQPTDLYFIHGSGKGKIASLASSYKKLNIKCAAIADFDILSQLGELKKTYTALKGDYDAVQENYNAIRLDLNSIPTLKSINDIVAAIKKLLDKIEKEKEKVSVSNKNKEEISDLLNQASNWSSQKKNGVHSIKDDMKKEKCKELLNAFNEKGLFISPEGELESWIKGVSKEKWLEDALSKISDDSASIDPAKYFIKKIFEYLYSQKL